MKNVSMAACRSRALRLINQRGIQIGAAKGSLRWTTGRLKCAKITDAGCAAGGLEEASMQLDDLRQCDVSHYARRR